MGLHTSSFPGLSSGPSHILVPTSNGGGGGGGGGGGTSSSTAPNPTAVLLASLHHSPIVAYTTGGITALLVIAGGVLGLLGFHALQQHADSRKELGDYAPIEIHEPFPGIVNEVSGVFPGEG